MANFRFISNNSFEVETAPMPYDSKTNTSNLKAENIAVDYRAMNNQPYTTMAAALAKIANDIADFEVRIAALEGNT